VPDPTRSSRTGAGPRLSHAISTARAGAPSQPSIRKGRQTR
jgi:hypothetical protein